MKLGVVVHTHNPSTQKVEAEAHMNSKDSLGCRLKPNINKK